MEEHTTESDLAQQDAFALRRFFERYAAVSSGSSPEQLTAMYAPTFIVGGPQGSSAFVNDERFVEWLREVHEFNRTHGMHALRPMEIDEVLLSPRHTLAIVKWGAQFAKSGERVVEFRISYLLERATESWRILGYISEADQEAEMKREGLL